LKNKFFDIAVSKAARLAGKPGRITLLLTRLATKMSTVNWSDVSVASTKQKLSVFARIAKAYASGSYRDISWKSMMIVLAAIIYFLNPIDLIPDLIPGLGLTDDFSILLWVYGTVSLEVDKFLTWERSTLPTI
jgi:uncharacterized membrane protein YkvA (DUF1232 family)